MKKFFNKITGIGVTVAGVGVSLDLADTTLTDRLPDNQIIWVVVLKYLAYFVGVYLSIKGYEMQKKKETKNKGK